MKFGRVDNPKAVDFTLPDDHPKTVEVLGKNDFKKELNIYVGCAKWNRTDLKNFYPKGTKDELAYYSTQFNSIELNATFYQMYGADQIINWRDKTPDGFKFFPKINQSISHLRRLNNVQPLVEAYCDYISNFEEKLGMVFLQMHNNFKHKNADRLISFIENFPKAIPLAVEMRNTEWFTDESIANETFEFFEHNDISNIIVDTAGRRDMLHMRLTRPVAFIRYVDANDPESDISRLDDWAERLEKWVKLGLRTIYFFIHQNMERESPLLSAHFIGQINKRLRTKLQKPNLPAPPSLKLFSL